MFKLYPFQSSLVLVMALCGFVNGQTRTTPPRDNISNQDQKSTQSSRTQTGTRTEPDTESVYKPDFEPEPNPSQAKKFYKQGVKLSRTKLFDEAIAAFELAIRLKPNYEDAFFGLGKAYAELGRWQEAAQAFHRVIEINPNRGEAYTLLQPIDLRLARAEKALRSRDALQNNGHASERLSSDNRSQKNAAEASGPKPVNKITPTVQSGSQDSPLRQSASQPQKTVPSEPKLKAARIPQPQSSPSSSDLRLTREQQSNRNLQENISSKSVTPAKSNPSPTTTRLRQVADAPAPGTESDKKASNYLNNLPPNAPPNKTSHPTTPRISINSSSTIAAANILPILTQPSLKNIPPARTPPLRRTQLKSGGPSGVTLNASRTPTTVAANVPPILTQPSLKSIPPARTQPLRRTEPKSSTSLNLSAPMTRATVAPKVPPILRQLSLRSIPLLLAQPLKNVPPVLTQPSRKSEVVSSKPGGVNATAISRPNVSEDAGTKTEPNVGTSRTATPPERDGNPGTAVIPAVEASTNATMKKAPEPPPPVTDSSSANASASLSSAASEIATYRVGVGDVLDVRVNDSPAGNPTLFAVSAAGLLDYPALTEPFKVAGLTTDEIVEKLKSELKRLALSDGQKVDVGVHDYNSHTILVSGLVNDQGTKVLRREAIPLYVILADAQPLADAGRVTIISNQGTKTKSVDLASSDATSFLIRPGDVVVVQANPKLFFYIGGDVKEPGEKLFRPDLKLTQAILIAGGLNRVSKSAEVAREGANGLLEITTFKLNDISSGKIPDPLIQAGDRITIVH